MVNISTKSRKVTYFDTVYKSFYKLLYKYKFDKTDNYLQIDNLVTLV